MNASERDTRVDTEIVAALREVSPALDEIHRARLTGAIDAALDVADRERAAHRDQTARQPRTRWRWPLFAVAAVAAAFALGIAFRPHEQQAAIPASGATLAVTPPANGSAAQGRPDQSLNRPPEALAPSTSLVALRGERARATVGTRVRLTLVGDGRVTVLAAARDGDIELALHAGRLLVDYDGRAGGTLRVRSPGALTTVVGTLFAVEVAAAGSRVAVARGKVRTETTTGDGAEVAAGNSWTSGDGRLAPISNELALALADHQAAWVGRAVEPELERVAEPPKRARPAVSRPARQPDLNALYEKAEAAMRDRSLAEARRLLETIVDRDPHGPLYEEALLDLARLALTDGDREEALRVLDRLPPRLRDPALAETADHLRARAQPPAPR